MMRMLTSMVWITVMIAFGFDAVAQPCDLRAEVQAISADAEMTDMPCHDAMMADAAEQRPGEAPAPMQDNCCCPALLTHVLRVDGVDLYQPLPSVVAWADPLPDNATSVSFEYEPPPPRA